MEGRQIYPKQSEDHSLTRMLNKLRDEIKRLGNIRGQNGIEVRSNNAGYFISGPSAGNEVAIFCLTSDLKRNLTNEDKEFTCTGKYVKWDKTDEKFESVDKPEEETLYYPQAMRDGDGEAIIAPPLKTGEVVLAVQISGKWQIMAECPRLVVAELTTDLTTVCGYATAKVMWRDTTQSSPSTPGKYCYEWIKTTEEITIRDPMGQLYSTGDRVLASCVSYVKSSDTAIDLGSDWVIIGSASEKFQFYNDVNETIPKYAIMQVSGVNGTEPNVIPKVIKPTIGSYERYKDRDYLANNDTDVEYHKIGVFQNRPFVKALYDTGTPQAGEIFCPQTGSWALAKGKPGNWAILVAGIVDTTNKILEGTIIHHPIRFGKIQTTFTNGLGNTTRAVSVKSCDYEGNDETGDAFNVYTPLCPRKTTDLVQGDVVGYCIDNEGDLVIVTDIWASGGSVEGGKPWVSLNSDDPKKLIHLHPTKTDPSTDEASVTTFHEIMHTCGVVVDDAGHVIGAYSYNNGWKWSSPWGIANPGIR